jgi:hypothetical protein
MNKSAMFLAVMAVATALACATKQREPLAAESNGVSKADGGSSETGGGCPQYTLCINIERPHGGGKVFSPSPGKHGWEIGPGTPYLYVMFTNQTDIGVCLDIQQMNPIGAVAMHYLSPEGGLSLGGKFKIGACDRHEPHTNCTKPCRDLDDETIKGELTVTTAP